MFGTPDGADPIYQRSLHLVAPWLFNRELLGVLYADPQGCSVAFVSDYHLLATLAAQARRGARQPAQRKKAWSGRRPSAPPALEQRAGELALINSIQQGMSANDFQGIVNWSATSCCRCSARRI